MNGNRFDPIPARRDCRNCPTTQNLRCLKTAVNEII